MDPFLASTDWLDHAHRDVARQAMALRVEGDPVATAERCFLWVRDEVRHAGDHRVDALACRASDVLRHRAGWCYAKSHLLAALLRANGLRAGLGYQRLSLEGGGAPFTLHGLTVVELPRHGWYRIDPRGNKPGVDARFTPPIERLAFAPSEPGESDLPGVHAEPRPEVVACLTRHARWREARANLPDVSIPEGSAATASTALP